MNRSREILKYILGDVLAAGIAWTLFYVFRKVYIEPAKFGYNVPVWEYDENLIIALIVIPAYWVFIYFILGTYNSIYRKSRLKEFGNALVISFLGTVVLFFLLLLDDEVVSYATYRYTFLALFFLQFFFTATIRLALLTRLKNKLKNRKIGFNTIIVGSNEKALNLFTEMENQRFSQGYKFTGYVSANGNANGALQNHLPYLGYYPDMGKMIKEKEIEEVIIAVESSEHGQLNSIISSLQGQKVAIKVMPDMYDIISGSVKMNYLFGTALIEVSPEIMPYWQKNLKRFIDIFVSSIILVIGFPFFMAIALGVKLSSKGPVFYKQERIGRYGEPFMIYKYRTMLTNAEQHGPQLSSGDTDPRITPIGRWLRKYRIDELPQFLNVLKGEMTLVGPRPERQFFIDQIVQVAPHYRHLLKVKPGITSWGQIKFGYAENVDQMVERLKFDILYIENMSLGMDLKIMFYTLLIIFQGKGK